MSSRYRDTGGKAKIKSAGKSTLNAVSIAVAKDSNVYIPKETGATEASVFSSSDFQKGKLRWTTTYAARLYYGTSLHFNKRYNPKASAMWFAIAKPLCMSDWIKVAKNGMKSNM